MKNLLTTFCLTIAVLLGSFGVSFGADFQKELAAYNSGNYRSEAKSPPAKLVEQEKRVAEDQVHPPKSSIANTEKSSMPQIDLQKRKKIQRALSYLGYYSGKIDGTLGASTREALKKFQKKAGLIITGELSIRQADFLLKYEAEEETKKLDAFANRVTKNQVAPTSSKTSTENKEKITLNDKAGITKGRSPPAKLVELAKAQTFIGKFGGQWFGVMTCDMLRYKKELTYEIALRIDGKKVFIDNGPGEVFTLEGSIATESMWLIKAGSIYISGGELLYDEIDYSWEMKGKWQEPQIILRGGISRHDGNYLFPCKATLSRGVSEKVEIAREVFEFERRNAPKNVAGSENLGGYMNNLFSALGTAVSPSQQSGQIEQTGTGVATQSTTASVNFPECHSLSKTKCKIPSQTGSDNPLAHMGQFISAGSIGMAAAGGGGTAALGSVASLATGVLGVGGSWESIIKNFKDGMTELSTQAGIVGKVIADLAEALGYKKEAAILRLEAKNISEKGDLLGTDDLDAITAKSEATINLINEKLKSGETLNTEQKKKMTEAGVKYLSALSKGVKAGAQISLAASSAAAAGVPSPKDGVDALELVSQIPVIVPKALSFITNSVEAGIKLTAVLRENDIAIPDTDELEKAMAIL